MNDAALRFGIDSIDTTTGALLLSLHVTKHGLAQVQAYIHDPRDDRKEAIMLLMAEKNYQLLKEIINKAEEYIKNLKSSDELRQIAISYSTEASMEVKLGTVEFFSGSLSFTIVINKNGDGHLQIYAHDPMDLRVSGIFISCDESCLNKWKEIISKTDKLIDKLIASNQMECLRIGI